MLCRRRPLNIVLFLQIKDMGEWASVIDGWAIQLQQTRRVLSKRLFLTWKLKKKKKSLNTLNKGTDNHLSELTSREDGFAMAKSDQTAVSRLRTIHKQRKSEAGTITGESLLISTLPHYIECSVREPSLSDSGFQSFCGWRPPFKWQSYYVHSILHET